MHTGILYNRLFTFPSSSAQHSVHPTGGTRRVFRQFAWFKLIPAKWRSLVPPTRG